MSRFFLLFFLHVYDCIIQVGLAVDDTKSIQREAHLKRIALQVCLFVQVYLPVCMSTSKDICMHVHVLCYTCVTYCNTYNIVTITTICR